MNDLIDAFGLPLAGGLAIGLAATLLLLLAGRVAGICGIANSALFALIDRRLGESDLGWRVVFLIGLVAGTAAWHATTGLPAPTSAAPDWVLLVIGGVLVGFGTHLGSGCTSGHGVVGLGRLSVRSLAAVLTFMAFGIATVFVARHVAGVI